MWTYVQESGELWQGSHHVGTGYSGFEEGKNKPSMQAVKDRGPIPRGMWTIVGPPQNIIPGPGIYVLRLTPNPGTQTFGRTEFLMHGDSGNHPGCASHGCIVMPHDTRIAVWKSGDTNLEVIAALAVPEDRNTANA
jgi:hypothetical protein